MALPFKIFLMSFLNYVPNQDDYPTDENRQFLNAYWGYDYLGVNWGNEKIRTMTTDERNVFKSEICTILLQNFYKKVKESDIAFFAVSSYATGTANTPANGFIDENVGNDPDKDWLSFIQAIVSTPYEKMTAEGGILHWQTDGEGKIRQKYNIMTDFFKRQYDIDLQAIGDDME